MWPKCCIRVSKEEIMHKGYGKTSQCPFKDGQYPKVVMLKPHVNLCETKIS
jgi:hypothetical protein